MRMLVRYTYTAAPRLPPPWCTGTLGMGCSSRGWQRPVSITAWVAPQLGTGHLVPGHDPQARAAAIGAGRRRGMEECAAARDGGAAWMCEARRRSSGDGGMPCESGSIENEGKGTDWPSLLGFWTFLLHIFFGPSTGWTDFSLSGPASWVILMGHVLLMSLLSSSLSSWAARKLDRASSLYVAWLF